MRFAGWTLDPEARRLTREDVDIHLPRKAFELLLMLVEDRPKAVAKAALMKRVWPGVFVSDVGLARLVTEVRRALGDSARNGRIIRTVHGYGYAFAADVEPIGPTPTASAACWLVSIDRTFALPDGEHIAGREPAVSLWLDSPKVSRHHAKLLIRGSSATIEDLDSTNGTFVRNVRISDPATLESGDTIRIGPFTLTFRVTGRLAATESEAPDD